MGPEVDGAVAGKGGILFHYNQPYGDMYMEVHEPFRRRGFGGYRSGTEAGMPRTRRPSGAAATWPTSRPVARC
jgi:hypothetical protein